MKNRIRKISILAGLAFLLLLLVTFSGCQNVFTFSLFSGLQRDPANMSPEQKQQYALDALASGDPETMAAAYDAIADLLAEDPENGDLHLLAADLAIGASGVGDLMNSLDPESGSGDMDSLLEGLDTEMLAGVDDHVAAAEAAGETPSNSQYINAGAALVADAANDAGSFDNIDWENDTKVQKAKEYAEKGGMDIESFFNGGE
jgi:hypothetical protein